MVDYFREKTNQEIISGYLEKVKIQHKFWDNKIQHRFQNLKYSNANCISKTSYFYVYKGNK